MGSTLDAMNADPLGSSYLVKRLSAASASLGSTVGTDGVGGGSGAGMCTRGSLTPSRATLKKVTLDGLYYIRTVLEENGVKLMA